jgi:hypothetical protein
MDLEPGTEVTATVRGVWLDEETGLSAGLRVRLASGQSLVLPTSLLSDVRPVVEAVLPALRNAEHFVRVPAYEMRQGDQCACGLDVLDPIHLRHNGRNEGRQPWLSNAEQDRVNARRREYGMPEITRTGTAAVCP